MKKLLLILFAILPLVGLRAESTVVGSTDNTAGWWTAFSQDYIMVKGDKWHFTIKNYTGKQYMWDNLVIGVTTDADRGKCTEHLIFRQDRETGGNGNYWGACKNNGTVTVTDNYLEKGYQESDFLNEMDGATIDITVIYDEDGTYTIDEDITLVSGNKYQRKAVCTDINNVVRLFFTVERSHIEIQEAQKVQSKYIGSIDLDNAWWRCHSDYYTFEPNTAKHISFTHHCYNAGWPYYTFGTLVVTNSERDTNGYTEYVVARMDNNIGEKNVGNANWGTLNGNAISGTSAPNDGNSFLNFMNGAKVDMYIYRYGTEFFYKAEFSKNGTTYVKNYWTKGLPEDVDMTFFFTGQNACIENLVVEDYEKPVASVETPIVIGANDNSTDYLKNFHKPQLIEDGKAYTYTFKNHAGSDRWQNYILSIKDENNNEIVLRSDKWDDKVWNDANFTFWNAPYINDDAHREDVHQAMDNATVTLTIYNKDGVLGVDGNVSCANGNSYSYAYKNDVSGAVTTYLSVSKSWLELTNEGEVAMPTTDISDKAEAYAYGSIFQTVNLTRTIKEGWNTICLPFATTAVEVAGEGAIAYAFTEASAKNELTFSKVETMEANVPYLFYSAATVTNPSYNNVTLFAAEPKAVTPDGSTWSFIGNYTPGFDMEGKYGVTGGKVRLAGSGSTLNGMRAYLEGPAGASASVKVDNFGLQTTVNGLRTMENGQQAVYDLTGRRVNKTQKGIYIINGKKVMK